ncbi:PHP-associated domain-containing protein [Senegalia sp. (in: firmicutes)]|uniref:PHP-associated domain-containing protein n=1 Tax=Senegalia sp. (in: firmicutes) TaxID=1924098 RepID=UPI003F9C9BD6
MIIDTHLHEDRYSFDSKLPFDKAIEKAKNMGLDGICVTNHDNNHLKNDIGTSKKINDILVIVGAEILTFEGDILVFGLDDIPKDMIHAEELLEIVKNNNGVAISAHPFRNNNRGLGEYIRKVKDNLHGIEAFNASTLPHHNQYAYDIAKELGIPCLGAGDAHVSKQVGKYATHFSNTIRDEKDFIEAIKSKDFYPVIKENGYFKEMKPNYPSLIIK